MNPSVTVNVPAEGTDQFSLLSHLILAVEVEMDLWSARDALCFKAVPLILRPVLRVSRSCILLKGHGGLKATVRSLLITIDFGLKLLGDA